MTQSTKFQLFDFLVYTVWACLKGMNLYKALQEESTNKNHYDDNYSAPFASTYETFVKPQSTFTPSAPMIDVDNMSQASVHCVGCPSSV